MTEKGLNIDQIIKDSSHRRIKKVQFLMGESNPPYIYCHGIETFFICLKTYVLLLLRELKGQLPIVLCGASPNDLIDNWPFFNHFATMKFL